MRAKRILRLENLEERKVFATLTGLDVEPLSDLAAADQAIESELETSVKEYQDEGNNFADLGVGLESRLDGTQVGSEGFKAKPPQIPNQLVYGRDEERAEFVVDQVMNEIAVVCSSTR